MKRIYSVFLQGLVALVPIVLTLYAVYWLVGGLEAILRPLVPEEYYVPGAGLVLGIGLIFVIGLLVDVILFDRLFAFGEALLNRVPIVKSIYGALSDLFGFFTNTGSDNLAGVVTVTVAPGINLIGFITNTQPDDLTPPGAHSDLIAVYMPLSYQIGGYTALLPRDRVTPLDIPVEDAMRLVLTAGVRSVD